MKETKLPRRSFLKKAGLTLAALGVLPLKSSLAQEIAGSDEQRTRIVVISDLHLGPDSSFAENTANRSYLRDFLLELKDSKNVAELVIAGDFFDQWFLPMDYMMPASLSEFNDRIVKNNQEIVDAINAIIKEGNIRVTYVPGNHDMLFNTAEVARIFPGINQARDAEGLGTYRIMSKIVVEHGHRYNFFCAPDPLSNAKITKGKAILPCGYFFTRIATSSIVEGRPHSSNVMPVVTDPGVSGVQRNYYYYYKAWQLALSNLPISESFSDKVIKTNINGFTKTYSVNDVLPHQDKNGKISVNLYKGIVENWSERMALNHVPAPIDVDKAILGAPSVDYTDVQAQSQYFVRENSIKVVVFGHTHAAKILPSKNFNGDDVIYANSGSWVDHSKDGPVRTYLVINRNKASAEITVSLYQYNIDGSSSLLKEARIAD